VNGAADPCAELAATLGYDFARPDLLETALTHPSAARPGEAPSYERLEFLGDRVFGLVVADMLMARFPNESEGDLARRHAPLVSRDSLVTVARGIGIGRFLLMSAGEAGAGTRDSASVMGDSLEAVFGALYLDGGLAAAAPVIERLWSPLIAAAPTPPRDAKTALQEWAQANGLALPRYITVSTEGPAHSPTFEIEAIVGDHPPATASGASKRIAEQAAAAVLLARIRGT
jgi:ribonuclease-3